jgi:hypothetical protein
LSKDDSNATHDNFSKTTLAHLARHGVESNTAGLFRHKGTAPVLSDYICFPWLIVEHKKTGGRALVEKCYCQAANAGTAAIMMLETLSMVVEDDGQETKDKDHIPPVVTITTVDSVVRVWIAYSCDPSDSGGANYVRKPLPSLSPFVSHSPVVVFDGFVLTALQENELHLERGHDIGLGSYQVPSDSREHAQLGHA